MIVLHIEHPIPDFERWKKAFDSDPIDRKSSGVNEYRIYKSVSNPNYVAIDLLFNELKNAEATLKKLEVLWSRVEGSVMTGPKAQIFEILESVKI
jgi:hypothetical protein